MTWFKDTVEQIVPIFGAASGVCVSRRGMVKDRGRAGRFRPRPLARVQQVRDTTNEEACRLKGYRHVPWAAHHSRKPCRKGLIEP